jgi:hypothetical protein
MNIFKNIKSWWSKGGKRKNSATTSEPGRLREFIYLDEVSLRSLLASQTGDVKDVVSEAISKAENAELAAELSADAFIGKGKLNSRYQTSNSRSIQTSRKAIIQSLFKDFRDSSQGKIHLSSPLERRYIVQ